jgi:TRAP-type transport system large permease protein
MTILLLIVSFSLLMLLGVPVVWSMAAASLLTIVFGGLALPAIWFAQQFMRGADSITLAAIPLFLLAGEIMNRGGLTMRIVRVAEHVFGRLRGGLSLVNVATAFVYGGISGSATADTGAVAAVMIPAMEKRGYPRAFAAALTAASGTLGIIVPPSIILILYGVLSGASIGGLFIAGLIPGVFIAAVFMVTAYWIGVRNSYPKAEHSAPAGVIARDVAAALPALAMPLAILGSIVGGLATATEAAAFAVIYALLVACLVYREIDLRELYPAAAAAVTTTGAIMIIMAAATPFGWILTVERVPALAAEWLRTLGAGPVMTVFLMLLILKVVGFWLDLGPALVIMAPILRPIAITAGLGDYQTGILFTMTLGIGLFTPPIGTNIFVVCNVANVNMVEVSSRLVPFWFASVLAVAGLAVFPGLTEWLPGVFGY